MRRISVDRFLLPALSGVLPFMLYLATACRDIFWVDSTELMLVGQALAVSHPPGYPLLTLIIRLFSLVPTLALPFQLNLVATLGAAGSCVMTYFIVKQLTRDGLAALFSALLWGTSFELWQQATALEVYSFQALIVSVLLYAVLHWSRTSEPRWLALAFLAFGLGLANHPPIVLWIPSLLVLLLSTPAKPGARLLGFGLLLTALAVCLYIYVPLRAGTPGAASWGRVNGLSELLQYVTGRAYHYRLLAGGSQYAGAQVSGLPALFGRQFLAAWLLAVLGVPTLWRRSRTLLFSLLLAAAVVTVAAVEYNIPDKEGYLLPAYFALLVLIGCGYAPLLRTRSRIAVAAIGALLVAIQVVAFLPIQNRSRLHGLADLSDAVIADLPPNSAIFTDDYSLYQGLRWLQSDGKRLDVLVVSQYHLAIPGYLDQLRRSQPLPETALDAASELWQKASRANDAAFGEQAKSTSKRVMSLLVRDWLPSRRLFWFPADFSGWPQEWEGLGLTMRGLCYEIGAEDTSPDLDSPLLPPSRYRSTLYRDLETQDLCRRLAATASRRGILQLAADNSAEAIRDFDLALQYFPDYPQAIENKGLVFFFSDQPDSARLYLNRFLELEPTSAELPKVREILARLGS
ncbi:DUF2723 domain-containing protein [candidate division WOR-3 bacterium]|nr:DUF2723 domain-containing protein [candidate division WOR-3 bacterium]